MKSWFTAFFTILFLVLLMTSGLSFAEDKQLPSFLTGTGERCDADETFLKDVLGLDPIESKEGCGVSTAEPSQDATPAPICTAFATIHDVQLCTETLDQFGLSSAQLNMSLSGGESLHHSHSLINYWRTHIIPASFSTILVQDSPVPSEQVIEALYKRTKDRIEKTIQHDKRTLKLVNFLLEQHQYENAEYSKLVTLQKTLEQSLFLHEQKSKLATELPDEYRQLTVQTEKDNIRDSLAAWMRDKALYEKFGGALYKHGDILIPLQAYQNFAHEQKKAHLVTIKDKNYSPLFDLSLLNSLPEYQFVSQDNSTVYDNYFSDPEWYDKYIRPLPQFDKTEAKLLALPRKN